LKNLKKLSRICLVFIPHTDEEEKKVFFIYEELQMGAVAKSYMRKGFLIFEEMRKYLVIYGRRPLVKNDFATAPFWITLYMRKILFSFLSVHNIHKYTLEDV
jgi:hypothetical protein